MFFRGTREDGSEHYHRGIDLVADKGTPVVAAEGGVVARAIDSYTPGFRGYGKTVVIQSSRGLYYLYGHLDRLLVQQGDRIKQGQQIGTVGYTAYSTPQNEDLKNRAPHLHFETSDTPYPKDAEAPRLDPVAILSAIPPEAGFGALFVLLLAGAGAWYLTKRRKSS